MNVDNEARAGQKPTKSAIKAREVRIVLHAGQTTPMFLEENLGKRDGRDRISSTQYHDAPIL